MRTKYNFQVNRHNDRKPWDEIQPYAFDFDERNEAIDFAYLMAHVLKAEIRLTQGNDPLKQSGLYIRSNEITQGL